MFAGTGETISIAEASVFLKSIVKSFDQHIQTIFTSPSQHLLRETTGVGEGHGHGGDRKSQDLCDIAVITETGWKDYILCRDEITQLKLKR